MRDFLNAHFVEFDDRNIRQSPVARQQLQDLTGGLVVPTLLFGEHKVVGFDPVGLQKVVDDFQAQADA